MFAISFCIFLAYVTYSGCNMGHILFVRANVPFADFIILPLIRFTEPDSIPWFIKWSSGMYIVHITHLPMRTTFKFAGKLLVGLLQIYIFFILVFFTSNLRTTLITNKYEAGLNTDEDIVRSNRRVYLPLEHIETK